MLRKWYLNSEKTIDKKKRSKILTYSIEINIPILYHLYIVFLIPYSTFSQSKWRNIKFKTK